MLCPSFLLLIGHMYHTCIFINVIADKHNIYKSYDLHITNKLIKQLLIKNNPNYNKVIGIKITSKNTILFYQLIIII